MSSDKIVFIDTETGGLDPTQNSLLSFALVLWENLQIIDSIEIYINDGVLNATKESLEINGIDLARHRLIGLSPTNAIREMEAFLSRHFHHDEKITLGGHNIVFDVGFLRHFLQKNGFNYNQRFSHRYVDTSSVLYYLYLSGLMRQKKISSNEAFKHFGIKITGRHTALGDAIATAQLFGKLLNLGSNLGNSKIAKGLSALSGHA